MSGRLFHPRIGLEVHVQLNSREKLFSPALASTLAVCNSHVAPFDVGLPGSLPVFSRKSVLPLALKAALSLDCEIRERSVFDRKHYFYHDLPCGYQITQYFEPFAVNGKLRITGFDRTITDVEQDEKTIHIQRIQLEQDTGKSWLTTETGNDDYMVDYNRAGIPLIEIVTGPDLRSGSDVKVFLKKIFKILHGQGCIADPMKSEGNFRFDVNISVSQEDPNGLGTRCEIKNMQAIGVVNRIVDAEIERQIQLLKEGKCVLQQTLGYNASSMETFVLRNKESAQDYRFMNDPDLQPLIIHQDDIKQAASEMTMGIDEICSSMERVYAGVLNREEINTLVKHKLSLMFQTVSGPDVERARAAKALFFDILVTSMNNKKNDCDYYDELGSVLNGIVDLVVEDRISSGNAQLLLSKIVSEKTTTPTTADVLQWAQELGYVKDAHVNVEEEEQKALKIVAEIVAEHEGSLVKKYRKTGSKKILARLVQLLEARTNRQFRGSIMAEWFRRHLS